MKKVIALKGKSNQGKTSTIVKVIELLQEKYPSWEVIDVYEMGGKERCCIFITDKDLKIGITTQGDNEELIKKNVQPLVDDDCKIIICATRTRGATPKFICNLKNLGYEIKFIDKKGLPKNTNSDYSGANLQTAKDVMFQIEQTLSIIK